MDNKTRIRTQKQSWSNTIEVLITCGDSIVRPEDMIFTKIENDGIVYSPTFNITNNSAQNLMDELWQAGLRPSEGTGSAGSLRATEKHLEDMRKIAFSQLDMEAYS